MAYGSQQGESMNSQGESLHIDADMKGDHKKYQDYKQILSKNKMLTK